VKVFVCALQSWVLGVSSDFETCVSFDNLGLANLDLTLYDIRGQKKLTRYGISYLFNRK